MASALQNVTRIVATVVLSGRICETLDMFLALGAGLAPPSRPAFPGGAGIFRPPAISARRLRIKGQMAMPATSGWSTETFAERCSQPLQPYRKLTWINIWTD